MDAQAKKKALYRAKLKAQKQEKRIDSPLVRYNESDQPVCKVCDIVLKSDSAWSAHQISAKHREAIKNLKANAAAASKVNSVKPVPHTEIDKAKPEHHAESKKSQMGPPQSVLPSNFFDKPESKNSQMGPPKTQSQSALPSNFFDKPETKKQHNDITSAKLIENDKKKKAVEASRSIVGINESETETKALPEGFFDDKDADLRARGITPVKVDIKDEYKEFEKLIQQDLKEVDNRMEEEEYDAAEMIEEAETVEQKYCRERVEIFKRKKMELKAARSAKIQKAVQKESSTDESSSGEDSDEDVDWRAKHL